MSSPFKAVLEINGVAQEFDFTVVNQNQSRLNINECAPSRYINLRGNADNKAFALACEQALGHALPIIPNTLESGDTAVTLWLGPDEWLLIGETGTHTNLAETLNKQLHAHTASVTEVSGGYTGFCISGEKARALIEKGCPLDLHPSQFSVGQCAQSLVAQTGVIIYQTETSVYQVVVRRSFADYLACWLQKAAEEFSA